MLWPRMSLMPCWLWTTWKRWALPPTAAWPEWMSADLLKAANSYGTYQINVMLDESLSSRQIEQAREALEEAVNGVENCTATVEISGMQELTSQLDMGLTVQISGTIPASRSPSS